MNELEKAVIAAARALRPFYGDPTQPERWSFAELRALVAAVDALDAAEARP